jgi:hypothetical protein
MLLNENRTASLHVGVDDTAHSKDYSQKFLKKSI